VAKDSPASPAPPKISAIVASYCEEGVIGGVLADLQAAGADEIIVADGGSPDGTCEIAQRAAARVIRTSPGRAEQMNAGARQASGDVLLFLHADVRLERPAIDAIRAAMRDPAVAGGNMNIIYEGGDLTAAVFTCVNRWRRRYGVFYGDSGIFCRRVVFEKLHGYRRWPIMEDYEFARRLHKAGELALLDAPIRVSARRWRKAGILPTLWSWFWIQAGYSAGISPHRLARWYRDVR
jgi:rSAM/selenodomain-associated transferase 2